MGLVYADIELINGEDIMLARRHYIGEEEIKKMNVSMLVDSGSIFLCINENIQSQLQLPVVDSKRAQLADGRIVEYDMVGPLIIKFKNRRCTVEAMVLPGDNEPLLGVIAMEEMDVLIHPQRQELIVHPDHPDTGLYKLKQCAEMEL